MTKNNDLIKFLKRLLIAIDKQIKSNTEKHSGLSPAVIREANILKRVVKANRLEASASCF